MATTTYFASEAQAVAYLTARFTDDGPAEIATYVQVLKSDADADEIEAWWKDISGDDLAEWLFRII